MVDPVEQHEHVGLNAGKTCEGRALGGGPHSEIPVDGSVGIRRIEPDVMQHRMRRDRRRRRVRGLLEEEWEENEAKEHGSIVLNRRTDRQLRSTPTMSLRASHQPIPRPSHFTYTATRGMLWTV